MTIRPEDSLEVITANRLRDGAVVYLAADGAWSPALAGARLFGPGEADGVVAAADPCRVVGAYAIPVLVTGGVVRPARWREIIRAAGPTVRPELNRRHAA